MGVEEGCMMSKHKVGTSNWQRYYPEVTANLLNRLSGFVKPFREEVWWVPRTLIGTPLPLNELIRVLYPYYDSWLDQISNPSTGDSTECAENFIFHTIPYVTQVLVQDGIYFIAKFPEHPLSTILQEKIPGYYLWAANARKKIEELNAQRKECHVTGLEKRHQTAYNSIMDGIEKIRDQQYKADTNFQSVVNVYARREKWYQNILHEKNKEILALKKKNFFLSRTNNIDSENDGNNNNDDNDQRNNNNEPVADPPNEATTANSMVEHAVLTQFDVPELPQDWDGSICRPGQQPSFFRPPPNASSQMTLHREPARFHQSANMLVRSQTKGPPLKSGYTSFREVARAELQHKIMSYNVVVGKDALWGNAVNQRFSKFKNYFQCIEHRAMRYQGEENDRIIKAAESLDAEMKSVSKTIRAFATAYRKTNQIGFKNRKSHAKVSVFFFFFICGTKFSPSLF